MISRGPAQRALRDYVIVELYADRRDNSDVAEIAEMMDRRFDYPHVPLYVILGPEGSTRATLKQTALLQEKEFLDFLKRGLSP